MIDKLYLLSEAILTWEGLPILSIGLVVALLVFLLRRLKMNYQRLIALGVAGVVIAKIVIEASFSRDAFMYAVGVVTYYLLR